MSKSQLYILLTILVVLNIFFVVRYTQVRKPDNAVETTTSSSAHSGHNHDTDSGYINMLRGRIQFQAKYDQVTIKPGTKVMDTSGHDIALKDIVSGKENLVFFFSKNHCYTCIDTAVPVLEELAKEIGYDKIMLIGALEEKRDILSFKERYKSRLRIFSVDDGDIVAKAKELNYPFLFILDNSMRASSFFLVEKDLPQITQDFMVEMKAKFSHNK
jgi:hypothetical protein